VGNRKFDGERKRKAELARGKKGKNLQHMRYEKKLHKHSKKELLDLKWEEDTSRSSRNKLVPEIKTI
jgi:hypothetical protein